MSDVHLAHRDVTEGAQTPAVPCLFILCVCDSSFAGIWEQDTDPWNDYESHLGEGR